MMQCTVYALTNHGPPKDFVVVRSAVADGSSRTARVYNTCLRICVCDGVSDEEFRYEQFSAYASYFNNTLYSRGRIAVTVFALRNTVTLQFGYVYVLVLVFFGGGDFARVRSCAVTR